MAGYNISNAPTNISLQEWQSAVSRQGQLARNSRFAIRIMPYNSNMLRAFGPLLRDLVFLTEATELPARGLIHAPFQIYGPEYHLPTQSQYTDLNIQFYCRTESLERQFFDDWMDLINPTSTFDFTYKDDYKSEIHIFQFAEFGDTETNVPDVKYYWNLYGAWPTLVNPQPVNWADGNFMRLTVTFTFSYWTRPGRSYEPYTHNLITARPNALRKNGKRIT